MKLKLTLLLTLFAGLQSFAQLNVQLRSSVDYPGQTCANICGYADTSGHEYALVGAQLGTSIVDVTDPDNPVQLLTVPGPDNLWKEIKTWSHYAYVTTEAGGGLQIVDLQYLPDSAPYTQYTGDGAIAGQLNTIHALHIDAGYVYLHGSNLLNSMGADGATVICDLADPWNPVYKGIIPTGYVHDGYVRNDTLWACNIYDGEFTAVDVHDKTNPVALNSQITPNAFTHNCWLSDNSSVLFTTDEVTDSYLASYNVSDVNNIVFLDKIQTAPGSGAIVHNTHILNDYAVTSWYSEGFNIVDAARPDNLIEVGKYDFVPGSGGGFFGCWGVYPFLPSGNIIASDMQGKMWVFTPTYIRACYLEGTVTDSVTTTALNDVKVEILATTAAEQTSITGSYKTGYATSGTYDIKFSKWGYKTKVISGVSLQNGVLTNLDVALEPLTPISFDVYVTDAATGNPLAGAPFTIYTDAVKFDVVTDAAGHASVSPFYEDNYSYETGKWNYLTQCVNGITLTGNQVLNIALSHGLYDDFSFDFTWTKIHSSGSGHWTRAVPIGTQFLGYQANPDEDVQNDCGEKCYVTGNDGLYDIPFMGSCILTTPYFDLTGYVNPHIKFSYWYYASPDSSGAPSPELFKVKLMGATTAFLLQDSGTVNAMWKDTMFRVSDFVTPGANMRLQFNVTEAGGNNFLKAAIDNFQVVDMPLSVNELNNAGISINVSPNPFGQNAVIKTNCNSNSILIITNATGKVVYTKQLNSGIQQLTITDELSSGIYFAQLKMDSGLSPSVKLIKQ